MRIGSLQSQLEKLQCGHTSDVDAVKGNLSNALVRIGSLESQVGNLQCAQRQMATSTSPAIELFGNNMYNTAGKCVGTTVGIKCTISGKNVMDEALIMGKFMQEYLLILQSDLPYHGDNNGTLQNALEFQ